MYTANILTVPLQHTMPSDRARAEAARVAGLRALNAGAALWHGLFAIGEARSRRMMNELSGELAATRPHLAQALRAAQRQTARG